MVITFIGTRLYSIVFTVSKVLVVILRKENRARCIYIDRILIIIYY